MRKQSNIAALKQLSPYIWLTLVYFIVVAICSVIFWDFLKLHHETIRNIGLVSAGIVGLFLLIWRGLINERIADTKQQSHVADTYTRAIQQLGAEDKNNKPHLELRLGALYAMEKIARVNREYHPQIMDVLCTYVRMHAPVPKDAGKKEKVILGVLPREDVQTVLTIIGRRNTEFDETEQRLNLGNTTLINADLRGANLSRANISEADLSGANLSETFLTATNLSGAFLTTTNLRGALLFRADLSETDLNGANLSGADLNMATLSRANLSGANLIIANLNGAFLNETNLNMAILSRANLSGANLNKADLNKADLSRADLSEADLNGADLNGTDLEKTVLKGVRNLTDEQLEQARNWELARR